MSKEEEKRRQSKYSWRKPAQTCIMVRPFGAIASLGLCVCVCCSATPILRVVDPHPSALTSLSADPLRAADQEQGDIEPLSTDPLRAACQEQGDIKPLLLNSRKRSNISFTLYSKHTQAHKVLLGCLSRLAVSFSCY